jgi:NodT family efflux transporter outer membrane factor (OMF) lipoprotein
MSLLRSPSVMLLAVALGLSACKVGPNYHAPVPAQGADAPLISATAANETNSEPPPTWWQLYNDPDLDDLLREALAANADLRAANANLAASQAVLEGARGAYYPQTTLGAGALYGRDATTDEILEIAGAPPQNIWIFDAILEISYELDYLGRVRRSVEAARADAEAVQAARDTALITVAAETARAYAQVCALGESLEVARRSLDVVSREADITSQRHEAGANAEFDVVRAQGLVAQVRATIPPLEGQRRAALFQLAALLGRTPANAPSDVQKCVTPPRLGDLLPVGDGASLLKRRPDIRQADRRVAAATARIGVVTADLYPRISIRGLAGGVSSEINEVATNSGRTWGIGPSISWTFPNDIGPRARVRQARAGEAAALASFDSVVLQALRETEQALTAYGSELQRRASLLEAQERAQRAFDMAHEQFLAGSLSNLELLSTEQSLISAAAAVAASDGSVVQDQIAVFRALGAGRPALHAQPAIPERCGRRRAAGARRQVVGTTLRRFPNSPICGCRAFAAAMSASPSAVFPCLTRATPRAYNDQASRGSVFRAADQSATALSSLFWRSSTSAR